MCQRDRVSPTLLGFFGLSPRPRFISRLNRRRRAGTRVREFDDAERIDTPRSDACLSLLRQCCQNNNNDDNNEPLQVEVARGFVWLLHLVKKQFLGGFSTDERELSKKQKTKRSCVLFKKNDNSLPLSLTFTR